MSFCPVCSSPRTELFSPAFDRLLGRPQVSWEVWQCRDCHHGWTQPPLAEEEIASYYPDDYLGDAQRALQEFLAGRLQRSRSWRKETEKVRELERLLSGGCILDVGCADGKFLWALNPASWRRTGVEFSKPVVELVQSRMPDLELLCGDIYHPALQTGSFDAVTFWHVLEHLPRPRDVLMRVRDLLRPGGWVLVSLPNLDSLQARLFRRYWYAFDDVPRHLHHFSPQSLDILLHEAGFSVLDHRFFSRTVNFHCLKHSLLNWSKERLKSRLPYYLLKPLLFLFPPLESLTGRYGMLLTTARKSACRVCR